MRTGELHTQQHTETQPHSSWGGCLVPTQNSTGGLLMWSHCTVLKCTTVTFQQGMYALAQHMPAAHNALRCPTGQHQHFMSHGTQPAVHARQCTSPVQQLQRQRLRCPKTTSASGRCKAPQPAVWLPPYGHTHVMAIDSPFFFPESCISMRTGLVMAIDSPLLPPAAAPAGVLLPGRTQHQHRAHKCLHTATWDLVNSQATLKPCHRTAFRNWASLEWGQQLTEQALQRGLHAD